MDYIPYLFFIRWDIYETKEVRYDCSISSENFSIDTEGFGTVLNVDLDTLTALIVAKGDNDIDYSVYR